MESKTPQRTRLPGLLEEPPISFYPSLAVRTGPNKALMLQEVHFYVSLKRKTEDEVSFYDGTWWVYNTYEQWRRKHFPWIKHPGTVKRLFQELEMVGILRSRPYDGDTRTKYYTLNYGYWDTWFGLDDADDKRRIADYKKRHKKCRKSGTKSAAIRAQKIPEKRHKRFRNCESL